jgi:hypothetical protein
MQRCARFEFKRLENEIDRRAQVEIVIRGPREGFTESLMTNLAMLRRKLKTGN